MELELRKAYVEKFDEEKNKNVSIPITLGVECFLDDQPTNFPAPVAETETGKQVKIQPTRIFYSFQHQTLSICRPPRPVRHKSGSHKFSESGLPLCTQPVKQSLTVKQFRDNHGKKFGTKVMNAIMACMQGEG
jgi:hypothetical protein